MCVFITSSNRHECMHTREREEYNNMYVISMHDEQRSRVASKEQIKEEAWLPKLTDSTRKCNNWLLSAHH